MNYLRRIPRFQSLRSLAQESAVQGLTLRCRLLKGVPLSEILQDPSSQGLPVLNLKISDRALRLAFREMASLVLELSKPEFPRIGSLRQDREYFTVTERPFTFNMNQLAASAKLPPEVLSSGFFESAVHYFDNLAVQHLVHLRNQRNDVIEDDEDYRKKYTARCLFRRLLRDLIQRCKEPFRLYNNDSGHPTFW